jgi:hypothetical protein
MSVFELANKSGKPCEIVVGKNGKHYCRTHTQSLLYVYTQKNGKVVYRCQIGEDMEPASKLQVIK